MFVCRRNRRLTWSIRRTRQVDLIHPLHAKAFGRT
jgi:hypothetical protein